MLTFVVASLAIALVLEIAARSLPERASEALSACLAYVAFAVLVALLIAGSFGAVWLLAALLK